MFDVVTIYLEYLLPGSSPEDIFEGRQSDEDRIARVRALLALLHLSQGSLTDVEAMQTCVARFVEAVLFGSHARPLLGHEKLLENLSHISGNLSCESVEQLQEELVFLMMASECGQQRMLVEVVEKSLVLLELSRFRSEHL